MNVGRDVESRHRAGKVAARRIPPRRDTPDADFGVQRLAQKMRYVVLVFVDLRQQNPARCEHKSTKEEVEENDAPKERYPRRAYFGVAQVGSESDREYGKRRTHAAGIAKITDLGGKNDSARLLTQLK